MHSNRYQPHFAALISAITLSTLAGCVTMPAPLERPPFPVAEYEALPTEGTGVVSGQVFLRTRGGDVRYGAGSGVLLNPVTSYSRFWYQRQYVEGRTLEDADPRQPMYQITTQADGNGNFRFENVPPGTYYLTSGVHWEAGHSVQGGVISKEITVENGKETREMLTR